MRSSIGLFVLLLAASGGQVDAMRRLDHAGAAAKAALVRKQALKDLAVEESSTSMDSNKLTKVLTTAVGIVTNLISAFAEVPPDYEYAIESVQLQGWKFVSLLVRDPKSPDMKIAKAAWNNAFGGLPEVVESILSATETGDVYSITRAVLSTIDTALRTCAKALPKDAKYYDGVADLVWDLSKDWLDFSAKLNWVTPPALVQVEAEAAVGISADKITQMLTTGVSIVTSFISAFSEVPPDYEYAISSFKVQGWRLVKLLVPVEEHSSEGFKGAKKAWDRTLDGTSGLVGDILEASKSGDVNAIFNAVFCAIDTALRACADVTPPKIATIFNAVADLIDAHFQSWLKFSKKVDWVRDDVVLRCKGVADPKDPKDPKLMLSE